MSQTETPATQERRERFSIEQIEEMVHAFYDSVRQDDLIGPIFNSRIEDWGPHLDRMVLFWRAVLRSERVFTMSARGAPPSLHRAMHEVDPTHTQRWLGLFGRVVDDIFDTDEALEVKDAAERIGSSLFRHLNDRPGAQ